MKNQDCKWKISIAVNDKNDLQKQQQYSLYSELLKSHVSAQTTRLFAMRLVKKNRIVSNQLFYDF